MPNPRKNETEQEFVDRFVDSEEAKRDFPDREQRLAVAYSKYRRRNKVKAVKKVLKRK